MAILERPNRVINRRFILTGIGALLAAPSIVRANSIMPVKVGPEFLLQSPPKNKLWYRIRGYDLFLRPVEEYIPAGSGLLNAKNSPYLDSIYSTVMVKDTERPAASVFIYPRAFKWHQLESDQHGHQAYGLIL